MLSNKSIRRAKVRVRRIARLDGYVDAYIPGVKPTWPWCNASNEYNAVRTRVAAFTRFNRKVRAIAKEQMA